MFERPHHCRIASVLGALDAERLLACQYLFGGGTAIALRHGEYRESVDIDFLTSHLEGFRQLRAWLMGESGLAALTRPGHALDTSREWRADQVGLRTRLRVAGVEIKFEIVLEARIELEPPGPQDVLRGVATLTPRDMVATKLLANSDRWRDDAVFTRDLIDMAMLGPDRAMFLQALHKAAQAYGDSARADVVKAVGTLRERPNRLQACMTAMGMDTLSPAQLWTRVKRLGKWAADAPPA